MKQRNFASVLNQTLFFLFFVAVFYAVDHPFLVRGWVAGAGMPGLLSVFLVLAAVLTLALCALKAALVAGVMRGLRFLPTEAEDYPVDVPRLRQLTEEYEALGFVRLVDYRLEAETGTVQQGWARLFAHPQHHCFGEINQVYPTGAAPTPLRCVVTSYLEDGWTYSSSNAKTSPITYMVRRPNGLWTSRPGLSPQELLQSHLGRRQEIAGGLGVAIQADVSQQTYFQHQIQAHEERLTAIKRKNIAIGLLEIQLFKIRPKEEWLGRYPQEAAKRHLPRWRAA